MSELATKPTMSLAERFWSLAKAMQHKGDPNDPVSIVRHVLRILDALDRGEQGTVVSVATVSFLRLLRESEIAGDLSYASPEQIRGEMVDERSLVFSVGVLLFERLTGRHPFGAEASGRRLSRISKVEFGSGVNYFPTVPGGLRQVLMRAMGPFPEERWSDLRQLRARLEQFIQQDSPSPYLPGTSDARAETATADGDVTRVVDMQQVILERTARGRANTDPNIVSITSTRASTASGETDMRTAQVATLPAPRPDPSETPVSRVYVRPKPKIAPLLWAGGGAAVASVVFFMLQKSPAATSTSAAAHGPSAAAIATAVEKNSISRTEATTTKTTKTKTTKATVATTKPVVAKPAATVTATATPMPAGRIELDPRNSTDRIGELLAHCFNDEQRAKGVRLGVSVLYGRSDGKVKATYYSGKGAVSKADKTCIDNSLKRIIAKPAPKKIVGYNMFFHAAGTTLKLL